LKCAMPLKTRRSCFAFDAPTDYLSCTPPFVAGIGLAGSVNMRYCAAFNSATVRRSVAADTEKPADQSGPNAKIGLGPLRSIWATIRSVSIFQGIQPLSEIVWSRDIVAGLELAATALPQALGYTRIAGMPVVTGLYALLIAPIAFAIFGSSRFLVVAADSATAAIVAGGLTYLAPIGTPKYVALAGLVALLTALMLILARIVRFGFLADFLSQTVLVGFLAGVGCQVGIAVLADMLGIPNHPGTTFVKVLAIAKELARTHAPTLIVSVIVVAGSLLLAKVAPRFPTPLVFILGFTGASAVWKFADYGISTIGRFSGGIPHFAWPDVGWADVEPTLAIAASCFLMVLTQSAATARVYALRHRQELSENSDLIGLSVANAASALSGAFVVNGSPTQTAMAESAGARSQIAPMTTAAIAAVVLLFFTEPLQFLPNCVLASLIFVVALRLIDVSALQAIRRESPGEFLLAVATTLIVLFLGIEEGIISAMVMSLLRIIRHSYHPQTAVLREGRRDEWIPVAAAAQSTTGIIVYRFDAALFYANASYFVHQIRMLVKPPTKRVSTLIVDASAIPNIDYTASRVVRALLDELLERGITCRFANVQSGLRADLDRHHLTDVLGSSNIYNSLSEALEGNSRTA
jgi:sulfate permease, SulP family